MGMLVLVVGFGKPVVSMVDLSPLGLQKVLASVSLSTAHIASGVEAASHYEESFFAYFFFSQRFKCSSVWLSIFFLFDVSWKSPVLFS